MKIPSSLRAACLAATCSLATTNLAAAVLVDTGPGYDTGSRSSLFNDSAESGNFQFIAGRFTLSSDATITSIEGWMERPGGTITVRLYADNGFSGEASTLGTELFAADFTAAYTDEIGWSVFSGLQWTAPTGTYWVAFEPQDGTGWFGGMLPGAANPLSMYALLNNHNSGWIEGYGESLGFRVNGTVAAVPLPAAAWLMGVGLMGLFGLGRRNDRQRLHRSA